MPKRWMGQVWAGWRRGAGAGRRGGGEAAHPHGAGRRGRASARCRATRFRVTSSSTVSPSARPTTCSPIPASLPPAACGPRAPRFACFLRTGMQHQGQVIAVEHRVLSAWGCMVYSLGCVLRSIMQVPAIITRRNAQHAGTARVYSEAGTCWQGVAQGSFHSHCGRAH